MATLVLAAAGSALGGAVGGSLAGLTSLALGKAAGASIGSLLDQKILGMGSEPVETGKVDRFRVMGSSEGAVLPRVFGRMRLAGQLIWSSRFLEHSNSRNVGGKGGGQEVKEFSYSINLAVAICEGEVVRIGRIWADGAPLDQATINWRLHPGSDDQLPDPVIAAVEGLDRAPAYRGTAYVVFENLDVGPFGNRIPQFNFEVFRRPRTGRNVNGRHPAIDIEGVALIPGTGEYALATEPVNVERGVGDTDVANVHNDHGSPDLVASLDQLKAEVPNLKSISLVVSWFGSDLRCDRCTVQPAVEQAEQDGNPMAWRVNGIGRSQAKVLSRLEGRPVFGGTPTDASVVQAIHQVRDMGYSTLFYPFILMDILPGNSLDDPWTGEPSQPPVPWRGRITLSQAPGRPNSPDQTVDAASEVASFFGTAKPSDFEVRGGSVIYHGPAEWSYRRFILHYAYLCEAAAGVDAFCIGSELRGLTQIRSARDAYPAVIALRKLAAEVREILRPGTKIGYAADWSEYFGHHPSDGSGDVIFNLDPLWADPAIDFIGIDNYMPLSDWRDGIQHNDKSYGSIYNIEYLTSNVAGGEGFDWYYRSQYDRDKQVRTKIEDKISGDHWIYRYKDLQGWWKSKHFNRISGDVFEDPTDWKPCSKPFWFTELGCPAIDKGTNQPNVFSDPKSSESGVPYFSNGSRDDYIQYCYLKAQHIFWADSRNNPKSDQYEGRMVDMSRAHVWAWDARPWPDFPGRRETWADGDNYNLGHWLNGRTSMVSMADVVAELCQDAGFNEVDTSVLYAGVTGYCTQSIETGRQSLQGLMLAFGFDASESCGKVCFRSRFVWREVQDLSKKIVKVEQLPTAAQTRAPSAETPSHVSLSFIRADMDYQVGLEEAQYPTSTECGKAQLNVPLVLYACEARAIAGRWLSESRTAREYVQVRLPSSDLSLQVGDLIAISNAENPELFRVDQISDSIYREITAVRFIPDLYSVFVDKYRQQNWNSVRAQTPPYVTFLDLPILSPDDQNPGIYVAAVRRPWMGSISMYFSEFGTQFAFVGKITSCAVFGRTLEKLAWSKPGCWSNRTLRVQIYSGVIESCEPESVLNGSNAAAIRYGGDGDWEIIQFCGAKLVDALGIYELSKIIRGQVGTEFINTDGLAAGADFVLLDKSVKKIPMSSSRSLADIETRIGPSNRSLYDNSFTNKRLKYLSIYLRPYAPCNLRYSIDESGEIVFSWIGRSRVHGDYWGDVENPLDESDESYHVLLLRDGYVHVSTYIKSREFTIKFSENISDINGSKIEFSVSQSSSIFGPGPYSNLYINFL